MTEAAPGGPAPLVFERRLSARGLVALVAALWVGVGLRVVEPTLAGWATQVAAELPAGPTEPLARVVVTLLCPSWLLLWLVAAAFVLPRRYVRAEVWPDVLVFRNTLIPGLSGGVVVPLPDVRERVVTEHGVRVWSRATHAISNLLQPLVVPAADEAEAARIHALLDAPAPGTATGATAGRTEPPLAVLLGLLWIVAWLLSVPLSLHLGGSLAALGLALGLVTIPWAVSGTHRRWGRAHAGAVTLSVLQHVVPWGRIRACAIARGWLAVEVDDGRRLRVRIGQGPDAAALRAQVARRLAGVELRDALPAWAATGPRRALLAAALLAGPLLPLVHALTRQATVSRVDHLGQTTHVLYRVWDGAPRRVVVVIDPEVARVETATLAAWGLDAAPVGTKAHVDLIAGRARLADATTVELPGDATVLVLGPAPGALAVSTRPLDRSESLAALAPGLLGPSADRIIMQLLAGQPLTEVVGLEATAAVLDALVEDSAGGLVELILPKTEDELLVAVREGHAARRCVRSSAADGQLLLRLELGQVRACAIVPRRTAGGVGCPVCRLAPADGQLLVRGPAGEQTRGRLPTWEEARAAIDAIAAGASIERATRGWAPPP